MLYNKKLVAAAGLDFEANPPKTVKDFDDVCAKIKATGVTPMEIEEGNYPYLAFHFASINWFQQSDHSLLYDESFAKAKFADDKGFLDAFTYYQSLAEKGYLNKDFMSSKEMNNRFLQGKAAMLPVGDMTEARKTLGDDLGIMLVPEINENGAFQGTCMGGVGQTLVLAKCSKYPEVGVKLMSFLNSKDSSIALIKNLTGLPIRNDISLADIGMENDELTAKFFNWSKNGMCFWFNSTVGPEVSTEIQKLCPLVLSGKMTPKEFAEALDKKVAEINK